MKASFAVTYCMYVLALFSGMFFPHQLNSKINKEGSSSYTMGFSNSPGFLSEMKIGDMPVKRMFGQIIPSGKMGICMLAQSYFDHFTITMCSDTGILTRKQTQTLNDAVVKAIYDYIKLAENKKKTQ